MNKRFFIQLPFSKTPLINDGGRCIALFQTEDAAVKYMKNSEPAFVVLPIYVNAELAAKTIEVD